MKKTIQITDKNGKVDKVVNYIPLRYIVSILIILFEILAILSVVVLLCIYVPYFYILVFLTQIGCVISILGRKDNPDYKIPWLFFVLVVPVVGFMCYLLLYTRKLEKRQYSKLDKIKNTTTNKEDKVEIKELEDLDSLAYSQCLLLKKLGKTNLYQNTNIKYCSSGETLFSSMINDLNNAKEFIFIEYFIIEEGLFWNTILDILKEKSKAGVKVYVMYDDIGCMMTLPGNYSKILKKDGIIGIPFAKLRGQANNEFNNRNHRKITVIDGKVGFTGGVNIADEYINHIEKYGHWKDVGIRLEGEAVNELTRLFVNDYNLNVRHKNILELNDYLREYKIENSGFVIPFGDGPKPLYERQVSKSIILAMLNQAKESVYITTPYLIIDSDLVRAIEDTALRGIDVRIITPHIPDKKLVFRITQGYYQTLIKAGVKIYEYEPGFIHSKVYICDGKISVIGTINLDYRSLVHHFENGVWVYNHEVIKSIEEDFIETMNKSILIEETMLNNSLINRFILATLRVFTPLL